MLSDDPKNAMAVLNEVVRQTLKEQLPFWQDEEPPIDDALFAELSITCDGRLDDYASVMVRTQTELLAAKLRSVLFKGAGRVRPYLVADPTGDCEVYASGTVLLIDGRQFDNIDCESKTILPYGSEKYRRSSQEMQPFYGARVHPYPSKEGLFCVRIGVCVLV